MSLVVNLRGFRLEVGVGAGLVDQLMADQVVNQVVNQGNVSMVLKMEEEEQGEHKEKKEEKQD